MINNQETLATLLVIREKYPENKAHAIAGDLLQLHTNLVPLLERWVKNQTDQDDYQYDGVSLKSLCDKLKMNYAAALVTMDWIIKAPGEAVPAIKSRFLV